MQTKEEWNETKGNGEHQTSYNFHLIWFEIHFSHRIKTR